MTKIIKEIEVYVVLIKSSIGYEAHAYRDEKIARHLEDDPAYIKTIKTTIDEAV